MEHGRTIMFVRGETLERGELVEVFKGNMTAESKSYVMMMISGVI